MRNPPPLKTRFINLFVLPLKFSNERMFENELKKDILRNTKELAKETLWETFPPIGYVVSVKDEPEASSKYSRTIDTNSGLIKKLILDSAEDNDIEVKEARVTGYKPRTDYNAGTYSRGAPMIEAGTGTWHTWNSFLTTFFGFANRADKDGKITLQQLAIDFIGGWDWEETTPKTKKILQVLGLFVGIKTILIPAFNLLAAILNTAFNLVKVFTEYLPSFIASSFALPISRLISTLTSEEKKLPVVKKIFHWAGIILLGIPHYLFWSLSLVGRAFSSPRQSLAAAWTSGRYLAGDNEILGYVLGGVFATLSLATTIATWAVLLPITIHLIPAAVSNFVAPVLAPVYAFFKPALLAVGHFLGPVFAPILGKIATTVGIQISASVTSIGVGLATIATPIATIASKIYQEASNFWVTSWRAGGFLQKLFAPLDPETTFTSETPELLSTVDTSNTSQNDDDDYKSDAEGHTADSPIKQPPQAQPLSSSRDTVCKEYHRGQIMSNPSSEVSNEAETSTNTFRPQ